MKQILDIKPPQFALAYLFVSLCLHSIVRDLWPRFSMPIFGHAVFVGGLLIMTWGWWTFKKEKTAIRPKEKPSVLVTRGVYRFSRNPMYLGVILMLLGLGFWLGSIPMFLAPLAFFVTVRYVFIPYEEKKLEEIFGEEYLDYKKRVPCWF